ncbi:MAG: hypothetical protein A2Y15_06090 [Clostridiales bacterium GWF2_36_10]|nr:MAG: hypothetical protein A2Y15_06090 [Clostridiales bacterium GWF2_36_10]HAN21915.1 DUF1848 domain-containing protein [Clostridiales bacterium]
MILSASRRTDIPCFYSDWFINRIKARYVFSRNPMNHAQISRVSISPDVVDCIVFWTKDAENIIDKLPLFDKAGYKYYFQFTLTPYDKTIEKNLRDKNDIENTFIRLSKLIGKERVLWRYDPIILNETLDINFHIKQFKRMCDKLCNYTESVTISFIDMYSKLKTNAVRIITDDEINELSIIIAETAKDYGLIPKACSESIDLSVYGIERASCIDKNLIERICDTKLDITQDINQRKNCGCYESIDIGAYNTCINDCIYCYANNNFETTARRYNSHNPISELLIGTIVEGEKINDRKVFSNIIKQQEMF